MILKIDARELSKHIEPNSVHCCVTSPPYYGLRDYGVDGQIGLESTVQEYVNQLVLVFREVWNVLRDDGTLWLNLGDSYGTNKQLIGIPWRVAFALQADGWYLRQDIIWSKPNPMPESVKDRCTKAHEYIFLLSKSSKYYYDYEAIKEDSADYENSKNRYEYSFGGKKNKKLQKTGQVHTRPIGEREFDGKRNKRSVWTVTTKPHRFAHFAVYPEELIEPCILAGCPEGGTVIDPFSGSGTTGRVAIRNRREYIGCELNPEYIEIQERRLETEVRLFA